MNKAAVKFGPEFSSASSIVLANFEALLVGLPIACLSEKSNPIASGLDRARLWNF
jgi:hypothetical protein